MTKGLKAPSLEYKYEVRALTDADVLPRDGFIPESIETTGCSESGTALRSFYHRYWKECGITDTIIPEPFLVGNYALESVTSCAGGLFVKRCVDLQNPSDGELVGIACLAPRICGATRRGPFLKDFHRGETRQASPSSVTLEHFRIMPEHKAAASFLLRGAVALLPSELQELDIGNHPVERTYTADLGALELRVDR